MPKKTKPFVRALCVLLALVAALSLTMVTAFAEELPVAGNGKLRDGIR